MIPLQKFVHTIRIFYSCIKTKNSSEIFGYFKPFCSKYRSWVHVRTASARQLKRVPTIYVLDDKYIKKTGKPHADPSFAI